MLAMRSRSNRPSMSWKRSVSPENFGDSKKLNASTLATAKVVPGFSIGPMEVLAGSQEQFLAAVGMELPKWRAIGSSKSGGGFDPSGRESSSFHAQRPLARIFPNMTRYKHEGEMFSTMRGFRLDMDDSCAT